MIFKKLNMEYAAFDLDNLPDLRTMLNDNCMQRRDCGPMADVAEKAGLLKNGNGNDPERTGSFAN